MKILAKKSLGQNFLINEGIIAKIVKSAELTAEDTVLEVGPGTGNLTRALVETGARVIAIEKDHRLIEDLEAEFSAAQIEIVEADVLKLKTEKLIENWKLKNGNYKIIANLPYYITSHFIRTVFEEWTQPERMILMVQKEVAQRLMAKVPDMNLLALSVQYYAEPKIVAHVSRGSFRPTPTVDSAVIKLTPRAQHPLPVEKEKLFFSILKSAFAGKRKQLINTLPWALPDKSKEEIVKALEKAGIDAEARPETIDLARWLKLVNGL
jgi:16S rRNA (adenine1518-N6/adenine1519-N6)-dimethyltransferase